MNLPTKIKNLIKLKKFTGITIPRTFFFSVQNFNKNPHFHISKLQKFFLLKDKIIIRSANFFEDNKKKSFAGHFLSIPNVRIEDKDKILSSIKKVINSYKNNHSNNHILIQKMVSDSKINGVIFTKDSINDLPYISINFIKSTKTDLITSGKNNGKFFKFLRGSNINLLKKKIYQKLIKLSYKCEKIFKYNNLDIEFSINKNYKINIFQVRKLITNKNKKDYSEAILNLHKKLKKILSNPHNLSGNKNFFSTMTDWNPAEIIGIKPKTLAFSLYKEIITDNVWSQSRETLGYKKINEPLMHEFLGTPYINVKTDISSFLPADLDEKISKKLLEFYLVEFKKKPEYYYDKVETDLVLNSINFNSYNLLNKLKGKFSPKEISIIKKKYLYITNNAIKRIDVDIYEYQKIKNLVKKIKKSNNHSINKIYSYINVCKKYGTLPFANLARSAFVGIGFLESLVDKKILNFNDKMKFLNSINSITKKMNNDFFRLNKRNFSKIYGHLRPNTYEISSKNYSEGYNNYFSNFKKKFFLREKFIFKTNQKYKIRKELKKISLKIDANKLITFIKKSIYHREKSKFYFTKIINEIFLEIRKISKKNKIKDNNISFLNIKTILNLYNNFTNDYIQKTMREDICENKRRFNFNSKIILPSVITSAEDVLFYEEKHNTPTFITNQIISSQVLILKTINEKEYNLKNKIICITNADPGFDFIFNKGICGLITAYGGPNSHMAIRCNELKIPAAIGIGDKKFNEINRFSKINLNCKQKRIEII